MFKFDFDVDEDNNLGALPALISYSPITSGHGVVLARRDLFDARFQLIAEGDDDPTKKTTLEFLDAPSDLVPGKYEGGLKTWECSLDLVDHLEGITSGEKPFIAQGKRILEIGCGTAIPSLYLLQKIFSRPPDQETHIHLQDYNRSVLELVTLPNFILAWYFSSASSTYRATVETPLDISSPSELPITPELVSAFESSLAAHSVSLRFFAGGWGAFDLSRTGGTYDLVLTSETIYRKDSLPALIRLLEATCGPSVPITHLAKLSLSESEQKSEEPKSGNALCLVAAKVLYFGVGGGVPEFVHAVQKKGGRVETVWERTVGVGRCIMRVEWD